MEKIDLTKCSNCRYKARIDGNEDYGRICVENNGLAFLRSDKEDRYVAIWHVDDLVVKGTSGGKVTDFEIVPRDSETYKDWQVGDKVFEEEHRNACYEVIFRSGELVIFKDWNNWASNPMTCSEAFTRFGMRLVLTDIEEQIIERKKYEPQDGDVCFVKTAAGNCFIFIKRDHKSDEEIHNYACFDTNLWSLCSAKVSCVCDRKSIRELRPATEDEKQMLFDAMAKKGKRWNAEKKVVEDIPKPYEFKRGEPVLVRNSFSGKWKIMVFLVSINNEFVVQGVDIPSNWNYCIPYNERTMHLLGTTEDYKEEI